LSADFTEQPHLQEVETTRRLEKTQQELEATRRQLEQQQDIIHDRMEDFERAAKSDISRLEQQHKHELQCMQTKLDTLQFELTQQQHQRSRAPTPADSLDPWMIDIDSSVLTIVHSVASGCFGKISKALWQGVPVAVKEPHFLNDQTMRELGMELSPQELLSFREGLLRECRTNARLRHPNIVQFFGVAGTLQEPRMLVMELMTGGSLDNLLYPGNAAAQMPILPIEQQLSILIDICRALAYLHSRQPPILHLDIKPSNIMFDATGRAKLADLGESHVVRSLQAASTERTSVGTITPFGLGAPLYMAPEMREQSLRKGSRTDMFSFGVVMCEVSSGSPPNPGPEMQRIDSSHLRRSTEEERRASDIALVEHQGIQAIVSVLIVDDMADRWSAAQTLVALYSLQEQPTEQ
jgi:serine/threonine protein kinase